MRFLEPSLEKRLNDNYTVNKDVNLSKEISKLLIGNPDLPSDVTLRELDLLTRNVENTMTFGDYIPGVIETAFDYCVSGLGMVESHEDLFGRFHARARIFLRNLAEISETSDEQKRYLQAALSHADEACRFYEKKDNISYGKALSSRGEIKRFLAGIAEDEKRFDDAVDLLIESAADKSTSASLVENIGKSYACRRYAFAANREYEAALLSSKLKIDLISNAIYHTQKSIFLDTEEETIASSQLNIGKYNMVLFELTDNLDFLGEAIHFYGLARSYFARFCDEKRRRVFCAVNTCLTDLKFKRRSIEKDNAPKKMRNKSIKKSRQEVRKIIMNELEQLD